MDYKQKKWTQGKCDQLRKYIETNFPLTEEQWESVSEYISNVVDLSKGNTKVRDALFDTVEPYQKKAEEMMHLEG